MSNMHLVTGYAGQAHVTAADHGSFYAALVGSGSYVMDKGNKFALSKISNNLIRILDGDLLMQGRHIRIPDAAYVELAVENGTQGYKRSDLVCVRYTKDSDTGVEESNLVILRGNPVAASPADPAYVTGNILDGDLQHDFPLYRLNFNGLDIASIDALFELSVPTIKKASDNVKKLFSDVAGNTAQIEALAAQLAASGGVKYASGSYLGAGVFSPNSPIQVTLDFVPKWFAITYYDSQDDTTYSVNKIDLFDVGSEYVSVNQTNFKVVGNTVYIRGGTMHYTYYNFSGKTYKWWALGV